MVGPTWELALYLLVAVLVGGKKIPLMRHQGDDDVGSISVGFTITFAAMLRFGPSGAVLIACANCLSSCLTPTRQAIHQLLFNLALTAIETNAAAHVFVALNAGTLTLELSRSFPAIAASTLVYFAVNTFGVAAVIALASGQRLLTLWRGTFLWTLPSYFAGACTSSLVTALFQNNLGAMLLFIAPLGYLTFQSYAVFTARAEERQRRIEENQRHILELQSSQEQLAELYLATIKSLALAIDAKDQYTHQHILRVQRYAVATARKLGLSGHDLKGIETGALLHDIGKLGVPEYVLLKPGRLTDDEFAKIKKHPEIGAAILDPVDFPWPVLPAVKYHHEKWDGTGYPDGLAGEAIPLPARILAVADVYDALTSTRSYRGAWPHEKAIEVIRRDAGTHFDPEVAAAFLEIIDPIVAEMAAEGVVLPLPLGVEPEPENKADQAARDIQRAASELWALYEVAQTLSASMGLKETLEFLANKLAAILPGTTCLFLIQDDIGMLRARAVVGVNHAFFADSQPWNEGSVSMRVLRTRTAYRGVYDQDDLLLSSAPGSQWTGLESALIVPIVHQDIVLGTINLYSPNKDGFAVHDQNLLEMIGERAALALYNGLLYDRNRSEALTDPLTGLFNIRYLTRLIGDRCAPGEPFSLVCLDLDSFKPINDNFGHQRGDKVLRELALILQSSVSTEDVVVRYGGDEFIVVLDGLDRTAAERVARTLQHAIEAYNPGLFHERLGVLRLGVSAGVASFPADGADFATLVSVADAHMYQNKTERKLGRLAGVRPAA
jgi:diguanylate cyclase (GGDEF)-like protein/putative nucleotidyltransferase with HDIG domain